jgi:hypothetical protein
MPLNSTENPYYERGTLNIKSEAALLKVAPIAADYPELYQLLFLGVALKYNAL